MNRAMEKDMQKGLIDFAKANLTLQYAPNKEIAQKFNDAQNYARNEVQKGMKDGYLLRKHFLASELMQAINFTVTEYPLSQADLYNMEADTEILLNQYANHDTILKTQRIIRKIMNQPINS